MVQLDTRAYATVEPLFDGFDFHQAHFGSVLAGYIPGRVFADDADHPTCAAILPDEGFLYLGGTPLARFMEELARTLHAAATECIEAFRADLGWNDLLPLLSPDGKRETLHRNLYRLPGGIAAFFNEQAELCPQADRPRADPVLEVEEGPGSLSVTVLVADATVSRCRAYVYRGHAEIDIETPEEHRRRGYATLAARAFLAECAARGIEPQWNCWDFREESNALAIRLGFRLVRSVDVFLWDRWLDG